MLLGICGIFLAAIVGLWGRDVSGVETHRGELALQERSLSGGGGRWRKVQETLGLALRERLKMRGTYCDPDDNCPGWQKDGDGHYRVPYILHGKDYYTAEEMANFKWVVDYIGRFSNLKFVERGADETGKYVNITHLGDDDCYTDQLTWSLQTVNMHVSVSCMLATGRLSTTMLQAAGFYYEHTHPHRDEYITVQNICPYWDLWFEHRKNESMAFSTPYDFASVMQLPPTGHWYTCPKSSVSLVAKNTTFQAVMEASKMAPSSCDLMALSNMFPGPVEPPPCVPHRMPPVCAPVPSCKKILGSEEACYEQCRMRCQQNMLPARVACRQLAVEEIDLGAEVDSLVFWSASSPRHAVHLPATVLLGCAVGVAFPLLMH